MSGERSPQRKIQYRESVRARQPRRGVAYRAGKSDTASVAVSRLDSRLRLSYLHLGAPAP
jgi:hypothetical protein